MSSPNIHPVKGGAGGGNEQPVGTGSYHPKHSQSVPKSAVGSVGSAPMNNNKTGSVGQPSGGIHAEVSDSVHPANHSSVGQPSSGINAESEPHVGGISIGGGGSQTKARNVGSAPSHGRTGFRNNRNEH